MKKLISMVLILCLACLLVSAAADTDVTGEWYGSDKGVVMKFQLNADGTGSMTVAGQNETAANWTMEGDQITISIGGSAAAGTVTEDSIRLPYNNGKELVLTREPIEGITVAEVKAAESEDAFTGRWACTYLEAQGILMDVSSEGRKPIPDINIKDKTIGFIAAGEDDRVAAIYNMFNLAYTFEDGRLALGSSLEGVNVTGSVELLEDGMIKLLLSGTDSPVTAYFSKVTAAE